MIKRREFLTSSLAFAAALELPFAARAARTGESGLRLGVLADLHVKSADSLDTFRKALRFFDRQKADGVVCAGDLATSGITSELERVGRAWAEVFPGNRRSDGAPIEKLFIYGDHDMGGYAWKESRGVLSDEELHAQTIPTHDPGAIWERCFHEKWSPVQVKTVKGYSFVLAHHPPHNEGTAFGNYNPDVEPTLVAHAAELKDRPFFYVQHRPIPGLAGEETVWSKGDPRIGEILRKYPNCVALTGHTHRNCTDEKMIWQGEFTAINIPCLRYLCLCPGRENSRPEKSDGAGRMLMELLSPRDGQQGYLMDVTSQEIAVRRLDFAYTTGAAVADPWRILLPIPGKKPYAFKPRASAEIAPQFQPNARVRVRTREDKNRAGETVPSFVVAFPPALSTPSTPRAFDYEVAAEGATTRVVKRVFSKKCYLPEELDAGSVECVFDRRELSGDYVDFSIRPCGGFGARGASIVGHWRA